MTFTIVFGQINIYKVFLLIRLQINPMHTIPVIVDGEYILYESRAILQYLANKYDEAGSLYPIEPEARARVDQKLYYDLTLTAKLREFTFAREPTNKAACRTALEMQMEFLDQALGDHPYVAGEEVTIADYSIISTLAWCDVDGFPVENYANVTKWIELCKENAPGIIVGEEAKGQFLDVVAEAKKRAQPAEEEAEAVEE